MLSNAAIDAASSHDETIADTSAHGQSAIWMWTIVVVGTIVRLVALGHKSFWIDEIASVAIARRDTSVFWHFLWHDEGNMGLYYVLLRPWLHLGYSEGIVRLLSVMPGILSIPVMYFLGKRLFGRETGIIGAGFLALNPCAIAVSQEARAYSFVALGVLASTYLFVLLLEKQSSVLACAYALVAGLTCYFHYFGVLVPAAHAISLAAAPRERRPWKQLWLAAAIIVVLVMPILWLIHAQDAGHISWVGEPSLLELYHLGVFLAASGGKAFGAALLALDLILISFFVCKFVVVWREHKDDWLRWQYVLLASSLFSPIAITLLVSIIRPAFYHRFLVICLPGWILMTALGVEQISCRGWRSAAFAGVILFSLSCTFIVYARETEDWRSAVGYLVTNAHTKDRVLYYQSVGEFAAESYRDWLPGGTGPRWAPVAVDANDTEWEQRIASAPHVWLVLFRAKNNDPEARAIAQELSKHYQAGVGKTFHGVTIVEYDAKP
jgi:mannosyltransferase